MTREEAIQILKESHITYIAPNGNKLKREAIDMAIEALEREEADGCVGCLYEDLYGDEEPCNECKNNYTNEWKSKVSHEKQTEPSDLISRAEAIRWVKTECNPYGKPTLEFESGKKVIEHLEQMPSTEPKMKWIPCSERLPKTGDSVLVTYSDGEVNIIWSARPKAWVKYEEANNLIFPVAWMPLPNPYREDGEG